MNRLIEFAVKRRVTILMLIAMIILLGSVSWSRTAVDLFPDITFPGAAVMISYPGAAPQEVEGHVTAVLEGALGTINNIQNVQSISSEGQSVVVLFFDWGTDMDMAAIDIREKLDQVTRFLPAEAGAAVVHKFDPSTMPIMSVAMASDDVDLVELTRLSETVLQRLERIDGVASVSVSGGIGEEVRVTVDRDKLAEYGLTLSSVTNALRASNINFAGGSVSDDAGSRWLIRTVVSNQSTDEIEQLVVGVSPEFVPGMDQPVMTPIAIGDVAAVTIQPQSSDTINRVNAKPNINLSISKRSDANTVLTSRQVRAELDRLSGEYAQVSFVVTEDQAAFIELSISSLSRNALIGGALALLLLFLFLRSIRTTLIVALSIPISVISTFILMYFSGLTVNLMTLSGLALGIGMLVDNSIVVMENVFRHLQSGSSSRDAAYTGAKEVATAITASTLTTVAVFLPVVFIGGITGVLFKELALTVTFSLMASLVVALTVIPMLSSVLLRPGQGAVRRGIAPLYRTVLSGALRYRVVVLPLIAVLFVTSLLIIPRLGGEFMPAFDEGRGRVTIVMADDAADVDAAASIIEQFMLEQPDVELVSTRIGSAERMGRRVQTTRNQAVINYELIPIEQRTRSTVEFNTEIKQRLPIIDGATIEVSERTEVTGGMFGGRSIQVQLSGSDLDQLAAYAEHLEARFAQLDYVERTSHSLAAGNQEIEVEIDLARAAAMGVNPMVVGSAIRSTFEGDVATRITVDGREVEVIVVLEEQHRSRVEDIGKVIIPAAGRAITVEDIADINESTGPRAIERHNNQRIVTVSAELHPDQDLLTAQHDVQQLIDQLDLAPGYYASFQGEVIEMQSAFRDMLLALALAIALVYMVMASQFESLVHPLTVMLTLPLAAIGVLFTLLISGQSLNIPSLIGAVVLAGIVVNNAIVLVDYINRLRGRGRELIEALLEAGEARLRPILITTLTTVLGLVPLALGSGAGSEMQAPLALTVIGGLSVGAFLTLFVIPLVYCVVDRLFPRATNIVMEQES